MGFWGFSWLLKSVSGLLHGPFGLSVTVGPLLRRWWIGAKPRSHRGDPDVGGPEVTKVESSCECANHQADNIDLIEPGPSAIHPNLLYTRAHKRTHGDEVFPTRSTIRYPLARAGRSYR